MRIYILREFHLADHYPSRYAVPPLLGARRLTQATAFDVQADNALPQSHIELPNPLPPHLNGMPTSLFPPVLLPKTHEIPVALIHLRSHFPDLLSLSIHLILHTANALGIPASHPVSLPTQRSLYTVPKSPFVHKKSQENFERKVHKRVMKLFDADKAVVDNLVRYLEENAIGGVGMRVVQWERVPLHVGELRLNEALHGLRESLLKTGRKQGGIGGAVQVKQAADRIIQQELSNSSS